MLFRRSSLEPVQDVASRRQIGEIHDLHAGSDTINGAGHLQPVVVARVVVVRQDDDAAVAEVAGVAFCSEWALPCLASSATALVDEDLAVDFLESLCNRMPTVVTSDEIQSVAATPIPFRLVRDGFDNRPGERLSIIYIGQPTVSHRALLDNEG